MKLRAGRVRVESVESAWLLRRIRRVVAANLVAVLVLVDSGLVAIGVVVRSVLDLVLGHADVDLLVGRVDPLDDAGRNQALLAEDPEPCVHDHVARRGFVRGFVDLADVPIGCFDVEAAQVLALAGTPDRYEYTLLLMEPPPVGSPAG